ncbi:hypothetical protein AB0M02_21375 [Actinoplanes sp. NPDC051861]
MTKQPPDWRPTREQIDQIKRALAAEAYPPGGREGLGSVVRRAA